MTATPEEPVRFAAVGLDHSHIFGQIAGLIAAGCTLVGVSSEDPDAPWRRRCGDAGRTRPGSMTSTSCWLTRRLS